MSYSNIFDQLHNIFVHQNVIFSNLLWVVFDTSSPNISIFQIIKHVFVNLFAEICYSTSVSIQNNRLIVVWNLSFGFGIDSDEFKVVPNGFIEFLEIPFEVSADGDDVGHFFQDL